MSVISVETDTEALILRIVTEFDASPDRVWLLWADPRRLDRWWGPPGYPATFTKHDLAPGSRVEWHMAGPDGTRQHGYWEIVEADAPSRLVLRDGFADSDGRPSADIEAHEVRVTIQAVDDGRTRMTVENVFPSRDVMDRLLAMGMAEGFVASLDQIDAVLNAAANRDGP